MTVITVFALKIIAVLTMLVDHTASMLNRSDLLSPDVYMLMRGIGRMAFPLFAFMVAEGIVHTKSVVKYFRNMAVFCFVSQLCYWLYSYNVKTNHVGWLSLNIFFTLALAVWIVFFAQLAIHNFGGRPPREEVAVLARKYPLLRSRIFSLCMLAPLVCAPRCMYGLPGVLLIIALYFVRHLARQNQYICRLAAVLIIAAWAFYQYKPYIPTTRNLLQFGFVMLTCICIAAYNGRKGRSMKYAFYAFYPAHLAALGLINIIIAG